MSKEPYIKSNQGCNSKAYNLGGIIQVFSFHVYRSFLVCIKELYILSKEPYIKSNQGVYFKVYNNLGGIIQVCLFSFIYISFSVYN